MSRLRTAAVAACYLVWCVALGARSAEGQVVSYRHRSTVAGDYYAGAAEYVRAQGAYAQDLAAAAETWVRVAAARDELQYQRAEYHYQVLDMQLKHQQAKRADREERQTMATTARLNDARRLWAEAQQAGPRWPAALLRPEYESSLLLMGSLLRNWIPSNSPVGDVYRRSLATEAAVLCRRIENRQDIDWVNRVEAVRTLNSLRMYAAGESANDLDAKLAMD